MRLAEQQQLQDADRRDDLSARAASQVRFDLTRVDSSCCYHPLKSIDRKERNAFLCPARVLKAPYLGYQGTNTKLGDQLQGDRFFVNSVDSPRTRESTSTLSGHLGCPKSRDRTVVGSLRGGTGLCRARPQEVYGRGNSEAAQLESEGVAGAVPPSKPQRGGCHVGAAPHPPAGIRPPRFRSAVHLSY